MLYWDGDGEPFSSLTVRIHNYEQSQLILTLLGTSSEAGSTRVESCAGLLCPLRLIAVRFDGAGTIISA